VFKWLLNAVILGICVKMVYNVLSVWLYGRAMKEPKIIQMDWKALGYERMYVDGRIKWVPQQIKNDSED
jgi:hypothetical protein